MAQYKKLSIRMKSSLTAAARCWRPPSILGSWGVMTTQPRGNDQRGHGSMATQETQRSSYLPPSKEGFQHFNNWYGITSDIIF